MRRFALLLACAAVMAACASGEPGTAERNPQEAQRALAGAPAPLARLRSQGGQLLGGGADAFKRRLRELRGYPVVVNKWASWCPPCRAEFPYFRRQALKRGKRVAFLGVDSNDNDADARRFLRQFPLSYPSYRDPDSEVAAVFKGVQAFPVTAFYDSKGRMAYLHQGGYATEEKLAQDIERYAR